MSGCKDAKEWKAKYRPDLSPQEIEVVDFVRNTKDYRPYRLSIWLDIDSTVAEEFTTDALIEFIKYRLNFKHGTDACVVIKDITVWPEYRSPSVVAQAAEATKQYLKDKELVK